MADAKERIPQLDGLRAIAVLLVFLVHTFPNRVPGAHIGVDIFFVLSGYLITTILVREGRQTGDISLKSFYWRRGLRLMPALALLLLVYMAIVPFIWGSEHFLAAGSSLYVMNWVRAFDLGPEGFLGHTWSLGIEEQFYLIWPLILMATLRFDRIFLKILLVGLIVLIVAWRFFLWKNGATTYRIYNGFDTRADALLIGCLLAVIGKAFSSRLARLWPVATALIVAEVFSLSPASEALPAGLFTLTALASASFISALSSEEENLLQRALRCRPLVALGEISYGFYLWHFVFIQALYNMDFINHLHFIRPTVAAIAFPLTLIVAWLSFRYVERPMLNLQIWHMREARLHVASIISSPSATAETEFERRLSARESV